MSTDLTRLIGDELANELTDALGRVRHCVEQLSDEQIWWRPRDDMNSVANVLLHLTGNLRQWVVSSIGGENDERDRPAEFSARGTLSKAEVMKRLDSTVAEAAAVLRKTSTDEWARVRRIQSYEVTGLGAALHSVAHFRGHTQEAIYMTRTVLGTAYTFAGIPATKHH